MIFYFSHSLSSSQFSDSSQSFLLSVSRSLLSSFHGEDSLSRSALGGRRFRSAWQWVSDRCGCGFRSVAVGFRSDGHGFQIEFKVVRFRWPWGRRGSWVWWVFACRGRSILRLPLFLSPVRLLSQFFFSLWGWFLDGCWLWWQWVGCGSGFAVECWWV